MFDRRNFWISTLIMIGATSCIESARFIFYFGSLENYAMTPLDDPLEILPYFNKLRGSMFYVHGFNETANDTSPRQVLSAYLTVNYTDVILLDWSQEAQIGTQGFVQAYALSAVPNTKTVGEQFGRSLVKLIENGVDEDKIHIVGHSLGAHLGGYAGAEVQKHCHKISRITGLDPAGPLFQTATGTTGLNATNAKFVDVLHTNPIRFGINQTIGSVDFWANCDSNQQPGCGDANSTAILDSACSHQLSCKIFADAILKPTAFPASYASNCSRWCGQTCPTKIIYLGDKVDTCACGNFYFSTNSSSSCQKTKQSSRFTLNCL